MDFAKVDTISAAEKGFDYTFIDPRTGDDTDAVFSLYGVGSRAYKQGQAKIDAYRSLQEKRGKKVDEGGLELLHAELLSKCTHADGRTLRLMGRRLSFLLRMLLICTASIPLFQVRLSLKCST